MERTIATLERLTGGAGTVVKWMIPLMVIGTCLVVVLRYAFGIGSTAVQESVMYLHAAVFMLGIAATLKADQHVRVDIFYSRQTPRTRAMINLAGSALFLAPVCIFILAGSLTFVRFSWTVMEISAEPGGLPLVFALKTLIPVTAALVLLQGLASALRDIQTLRGR